MSSNSNEINSSPNDEGEDTIGDQFVAMQDKTRDGLKIVIFNETNLDEWVEAVPEKTLDLEEMR